MNIAYPVKLDDPVTFGGQNIEEITQGHLALNDDFTEEGVPATRNGYDSSAENDGRGIRLTNIAGIRNGDLLKRCPKCKAHLAQGEFDPARTTNERRDQSYCIPCR